MSAEENKGRHPLKMLAGDHAKEALVAFGLSLPHVAIHHLRKAVDLVPLDIVLGYWLAVSSSQLVVVKSVWKRDELRFDALRSRRAKKMNLSSKPWPAISSPLGQSERLGELDVAKEYARTAHQKVRIIGWQSLNTVDNWPLAATKTRRLNWRKKHSGCARVRYVGCRWTRRFGVLGKRFDDFRVQLRKTVAEETEQIAQVEALTREFAVRLGPSETAAAKVQKSMTLKTTGSAQFTS